MKDCMNCIHKAVCKSGSPYDDSTDCDNFVDERSVVKLPCNIGDVRYRINRWGNVIEEAIVGIHYGRPLRRYGKLVTSYLVARSTVTGGTDKVSFEEYEKDTFSTREEAGQEAERRKSEEVRRIMYEW